MNLGDLQKQAHQTAVEKGFWSSLIYEVGKKEPVGGALDGDRNNGELIALMHSELSEALEACRHNKWSGKDSVGEELADCVIRILDFCEARNIDLEKEVINKMEYNKTRPYKHKKEF